MRVQEGQVKATALRNTGVAVITDIGNPINIHPTNKQDVGRRLALLAQNKGASPLYRQFTREGDAIRIWFDHAGRTLKTRGDVDLSSLALPDLVAQTIASTLGFREGPQRSARAVLIDTLRDRELLLVLDTCEHLIGACADLVEALLREAPSLRVIATSREALGVAGEIVYRVPSLSLPEPAAAASAATSLDSEATQLFAERARTVDPTFAASPANAGAIARLCCRLDGIPLAIELAAARVAILSPEQIEGRLQDRFRLLTGGTRTAVARQRTLEATVDWSYGLLSEEERRLLSRLSVFPATWSMEAAEDVCSGDGIDRHQVLELLSRLVGKSLVVADSEYPDVGAIASSKRSDSTHANVWNRQATRVVRENGISSSSSPGFVACCRSSGTTISWRDSNEFDWNRKTFGALSTGRSRQRLTRTSVSSSLERCSGSGPNAACIPRENSGSDRRSPQPPVRRVRCGHAH